MFLWRIGLKKAHYNDHRSPHGFGRVSEFADSPAANPYAAKREAYFVARREFVN
jgi:hypothetical protein